MLSKPSAVKASIASAEEFTASQLQELHALSDVSLISPLTNPQLIQESINEFNQVTFNLTETSHQPESLKLPMLIEWSISKIGSINFRFSWQASIFDTGSFSANPSSSRSRIDSSLAIPESAVINHRQISSSTTTSRGSTHCRTRSVTVCACE